jgi:HK97 family phage portal protein
MGLFGRVRKAVNTLYGREAASPTIEAMVKANVVPWETQIDNRTPQYLAAELLSRYVGTSAVCIDRITQAVASTKLCVYSSKGGKPVPMKRLEQIRKHAGPMLRKRLDIVDGLKEITDPNHPVLKMMDRCWPGGNFFQLVEQTQGHLCLTGNAYWVKIKGPNGYPVQLWPANPASARVIKDRVTFIGGYVYGKAIETEIVLNREDVAHFKNPNFQDDPYMGRSDIEKCLLETDMARLIVQHGMATLLNGSAPGQIIMPMENRSWSDRVREQIETTFRRKFSGADKAGRTMVLSERVEVKEPNPYQRELSYLVSSDQMRDRICNVFAVPVALLTLDTAALANAKEAEPQFYKFGVLPRLKRLEDTLNDQVMPDFREALGDDSLCVGFESPNHDDEMEKIAAFVAAAGGPIMTVNEAREKIGKPPIKGGDTLPQAQTSLLGGFGGFTPGQGPPIPEKPDIPAAENGNSSIPSNSSNDLKDRAAGKSFGGDVLAAPACRCCESHPRSTRAALAAKDNKRDVSRFISDTERRLIQAVIEWFQSLFANLDPAQVAQSGRIELSTTSEDGGIGRILETFADATGKPLAEVALFGYNWGAKETTRPVPTLAELNAPALAELRNNQLRLASNVLQSAEDVIRGSLEAAIAEGKGLAERTAAVKQAVADLPGYAAERIAQTETTRAFCQGRENAWSQSGQVVGKEWLMSGNPCPICVALNGKKVRLGEPFARAGQVVGGVRIKRDIPNPPGHPNCRCDIAPLWEEDL